MSIKEGTGISNQEKFTSAVEVIQNETRLSIYMFLRMNKTLTALELTKLVGKTKSTVHHHLRIMVQAGLIREVDKHRDKFDPMHYELVPRSMRVHSFASIPSLPSEKQTQAYHTTTKLTKVALFFLNRILSTLSADLERMESEIINSNNQVDPRILQELWEGASDPLSMKEIFNYSTYLTDEVYSMYIKGLLELHTKINEFRVEEEKKGKFQSKHHFIFNIAAPLGRFFKINEK